MTDFERQVLADLSTLRAEMRALLGNGQPGRLRKLEEKVETHETVLQRLSGVGVFLGGVLTLLHFAIDFFKPRH